VRARSFTPWHIRESAIFSLEEGYTSYTSNKGLVKLRTYLTRDMKKRFGLNYDMEEEILITVGVSEAVDLALRALLQPGEEVLIPSPNYVSYAPVTQMAGGVPVLIPLKASNGFKLTPKVLEQYITPDTKALLLNYPCNPTGASYTKKELLSLNKVVARHDLLVISDEVYDELTYDYDHTPFATLPGAKARTVYLNGFSKSWAMTGWRVGYACGPREAIAAMTKIHQYTIMCVPITSQMAACEAVVGPRAPIEEMTREYARRRIFVIDHLNKMGLRCRRPEGTFYAFASVKKTGLSSVDFCSRLLKDQQVAVVPGTAFGPQGEGYVRMSFASSMEKLKEAMNRIEAFVRKIS